MGKKDDKIEVKGNVIDINRGVILVKVNENFAKDHVVTATLSGKMRIHKIRVLPGDNVTMLISPYDLTRAIIIKRD